MGLLSRRLGITNGSMEDPSTPLAPLMESFGVGMSDAGMPVTEKQAMRLSTAYSCIKIVSEDLAALPLLIYKLNRDGSVSEAVDHPYYWLLKEAPNSTMTSMSFRTALLGSALAYGRAFAYIHRDKFANAVAFTLLASDKTSPVVVNGKFGFATTQTPSGNPSYIDPINIAHIYNTSLDGINGLSPISECRNAFGLGLAAEKFGAQFFANGARSTGVFSHPGALEGEAYDRLRTSVQAWATGDNALKPIVLEEGMKWEQLTIPPNDAQFLETRKFQRSEIAQLYRVPLHLLQDLERSTNNNIEHQSLDYVKYCLKPWAVRIEQELKRKLFFGKDVKRYCVEHDMADIQRGDFESQTLGNTQLRNAGVFSANDILRRMRMNPIPANEGGDVRLAPANTVSLTALMGGANLPKQLTDGGETPDGDE